MRLRVIASTGLAVALASGALLVTDGPWERASAGTTTAAATVSGAVEPKLACNQLTLVGTRPQPGVPDFGNLREAPTRITSAKLVDDGKNPEYCKVEGYVAPQVSFQLNLPTKTWQGRYLQKGCGGYCGDSPDPGASPACELQPGGDFAMAATTSGHRGLNGLDGLWAANDKQLRIDWAHRAQHVTAVASKAIIQAFYGTPAKYSYFEGCSTGGRMALMEAQRYPDDFDGIIAGAPANIAAPLEGEFETWISRVNQDSDGEYILTEAKLPALHKAVMAACDAKDGLKDGQIDDPRRCDFDPATIRCEDGADSADCLTPAQVTATRKLYQGPADDKGRALYPGGMPYGSELVWPAWAMAAPGQSTASEALSDNWLKYIGFPIGEKSSSWAEWKFTVEGFDRMREMGKLYNAVDPDLSAFKKSGGKLILWHGWADSAIPPLGTIAYYDAIEKQMGGRAATKDFARLFMLPTTYHCAGGYGPNENDMLNPLVKWVEEDSAPKQIITTKRNDSGEVTRTRPVFPYPMQAKYQGSGSVDDAENFTGVMPSRPAAPVEWVGKDLFTPR